MVHVTDGSDIMNFLTRDNFFWSEKKSWRNGEPEIVKENVKKVTSSIWQGISPMHASYRFVQGIFFLIFLTIIYEENTIHPATSTNNNKTKSLTRVRG